MDKALAALKSLAASGGFLHQIKLRKVQSEIKSRVHQEQQNIHEGKKILMGMNKYGDAAEKPLVFDAAAPENKKDPYLGIQPLSLSEAVQHQKLNHGQEKPTAVTAAE